MIVKAPLSGRIVAALLLDYLRQRLPVSLLEYQELPEAIGNGWETNVFRFQLHDSGDLPPEMTRPLVVRAYCTQNGLARVDHEFAIQGYLASLNYPVARPLLLEASDDPFGGPFMIMEHVEGRPLLEVLLYRFWSLWPASSEMAQTHVQLHQLLPDPCARPATPLLARNLGEMEANIQDHGLFGLAPGLDWLEAHQPGPPQTESIVHLDFHPINLIFNAGRCRAVLDWGESDVGDRHADIGATVMLLETAPVVFWRIWKRVGIAIGKHMLKRWYVQAYQDLLPIDEDRLRYYVAWAALRRLCLWGRWLRAGPGITGAKPSTVHFLKPGRLNAVCRGFQWRTRGVDSGELARPGFFLSALALNKQEGQNTGAKQTAKCEAPTASALCLSLL